MWRPKDKEREFVKNVARGGKLYRVINAAGVPYSIIEQDGIEILSAERSRENGMLKYWESMN